MIWEIIILLLGIPVGFLLAWLARDELSAGQKWFKALIILSVVVGAWMFLTGQAVVGWTCGFVVIVALIGLMKTHKKIS